MSSTEVKTYWKKKKSLWVLCVFNVHLKSISFASRPKYLVCNISLPSKRILKAHLIFSPSYEIADHQHNVFDPIIL